MEFDRRVQIRVSRVVKGVRKKGFGSGYLVAPRLVLTAAHVLDHLDPDGGESPVTVSLPDTGETEFPGAVCWQRVDDTVDAALIEVADGHGWQVPQSLADLLTRPPQRYGLIIGARPHPVTATGFPRMQKDAANGRRLDEQFIGNIAPGTGSLAGRYELTSTDPTFTAADDTAAGSRWSGMSGAAVLADDGYGADLLCGVTRRDRQADRGGTRLTATPAAHLLADETFRTLITEHTGWEPVLEPVEPAPLLIPAAVDRNLRSPAALLRADAEAVTFLGRDSELANLEEWCRNDQPGVDIRVLTGPGGQGKTRLARRLTDILSWHGWATGHVSSDLTDDPPADAVPPDFTTLTTSLPLLLVVDYAETRPRLLRRLITYLHRTRHRVRVLLLARSDGQWRTGSLQAIPAVRDLLEEAPVIPLTPLISTSQPAQGRRDAFRQSAHDLAGLLPLLPALPAHNWTSLADELRPPADLHDNRYDNVLTLQMAALVALLQQGPQPVDAIPGTPPERTLLKHEDRFWEASAKSPAFKLDLSTATLSAAVAVAALCGAGTRDEAVDVIRALPDLQTHQTAPTVAWLASLYPTNSDRYWGSLQPDRIAEYHASHILAVGEISLPALLDAAAPGQQAQLIAVLARAAIAHYNARRVTDSESVLHALGTALDSTSLAFQAVEAAAAALPYPSRITGPLALRLTTVIAHSNRQMAAENPAAYEPPYAASLFNLGSWLAEVGRGSEALAAIEEAAGIYQRLAADNPAVYEPNLAGSLSNLGIQLAEAGRRSEALTATEQAVEIRRRLTAVNPAAYEPNLATSLSNLGNRLAQVGRRSDALAATEEAAGIYQRLAADNPAAYEPNLAGSLSNLGIQLAEAGRRSEALAAEEQAVEIRRRLAAVNPAAYEPNLAISLSNLGNRLAQVGRRSDALAAIEEAAGIYQRLAADNPAAYERDLAGSLSNLGSRLAEAGRRSEALAAEEQAVEIRRRLTVDNPAAYEPNLAISLSNLGNRLAQVGRRSDALAATEEAAGIYQRLAADNPAAYEPNLASSLSNLGIQLAEAGRRSEALTATEQAVEIRRRLTAVNPAAYEPDLASSLSNLGSRLAEAGRRAEALAAEEQAVEIRRRLTVDNPAAYEPNLASSLSNLGSRLAEAGRRAEALAAEEQAVEIRRRLTAVNPAAYEPDLAGSLSNLGSRLAQAGRRSEALTATEQAVKILRRLTVDNPAAYEPNLAGSLSNLGNRLAEVGRGSEALAATGEAAGIYQRLAADNPAVYEPNLAGSLSNLGIQLAEAGRRSEALTATEQAVEIRRRLTAVNPAAYEPNLANSLSNLGIQLAQAGRRSEALTATEQAVEIQRRLTAVNPAAYEPNLANSLSNLGIQLAQAGRRSEALTATEQAVEIQRRLTAVNPAAYEPNLANSLSNLGAQLAQAGRRSEALAPIEEVAGIYQRLAADNPAAYEPNLASSLSLFAALLRAERDFSTALRVTREVVDLFRSQIATRPSVAPQLHAVLGLQADLLEALGHVDEAEEVRRWLSENPLLSS